MKRIALVVISVSLLMLASLAHAEVIIDLDAIKAIESSGRLEAYNAKSGAIGWYQITEVCLEDFNSLNEANYSLLEMREPQKATRVAYWYINERIPRLLSYYAIQDTVSNRLWAYNAGIGTLRRGYMPYETKAYIAKYERITNGRA